MTPRYHLSRWFVAGQVACRLDAPTSFRNRISRLRAGVTAIRGLMRSALEQRKGFTDYRSWMVEQLGPVALETGRVLGWIGAPCAGTKTRIPRSATKRLNSRP